MASKPRTNYCWWCGRRFRGRTHSDITLHGHDHSVHLMCEQPALDDEDIDGYGSSVTGEEE